MSIHVALNHLTHYTYDREVRLSPQIVRLRPAPHCRTRILAYSLRVDPPDHFVNWQQDPHSNFMARLAFPNKTRELRIEVDLVAEMSVLNPFDFFLADYVEEYPFDYEANELRELLPYFAKVSTGRLFCNYLSAIPRFRRRTIDFLVDLNRQVANDIRYLIRLEAGVQTPEETLEKASGSCRDSAWLLVQLLRYLRIAARFVSGYLIQLKPDVKSLDGPSGPEADFTDLHAWCEVYLPGAGWVGLDPTSGLMAGEGHIPLACTPEQSSAAPVTGSVEECKVTFHHAMKLERVVEAPRVTKPYSESQWERIELLGQAVDRDLTAHDVRLTMGGEPTFVSVDDREGAEWETAALGPTKRILAANLFRRLRAKYAPGGLTHFGQGKWYPGEQLPRWSLNCFWRRDGEPIWNEPNLVADETIDYSAGEENARRFLTEVAERLGQPPSFVFPAYEDVFYYLWRERRLPINVDPFDSRLEDPLERERLARIFTHGLDRVAGYVFPLARDPADSRWRTDPWFLRSERCYLIPGDSPMGLRLPLDSIPWVAPGDRPPEYPPDQFQAFPPLPRGAEIRGQLRTQRPSDQASEGSAPASRVPMAKESASWTTRAAMCAEVRGGVLYIFMPPAERLENYLELVAAVEATAQAQNQPIIVEGYEPPHDPRLNLFRITPDPGVIEVNLHPSESWQELSERTTFLYEAARASRLTSEKFMLDGRHSGTGGGNHLVLGGPTASDSPLLRRPDLLRSLLSYWHNHPSLSYLFSGLFIGPTSQAPRVDEARNDSLHELEIAFRQFPPRDESCPPWLVDRLLRNLMIDVTGNTHRAEFCIDKLYAPEGPMGRRGLLELRAFEMPPHERMSLVEQLLLRALVARFWIAPYEPARLARWGTELHDRFMLPYFVEQDFADVIAELRAAGYPIEPEWFAPHFEFRFPKIGDFATGGIAIELRQALEPWHVLGEEGGPTGTARYVDSSLERLQVRVTGLPPDRYVITCNKQALPMRPTGTNGEVVGGVRYRAWQPPFCLHPTIGVHSPLVFDLVDTWMQRSLGGCQYHVVHPGGRHYEDYPVNAYVAENRRLARFFRFGHTPGRIVAEPARVRPELPFTLDLRCT